MAFVVSLIGVALIAIALRDIFHELFHPGGNGTVSHWVIRIVWRCFQSLARDWPSTLQLAGPTALLAVIASWALLLAIGWALVYLPQLPGQFLLATGLDPARQGGFIEALYVSVVTLSTLGYGDFTPNSSWLRLLAPLEALIGFALLTAAISWVISLYPVLSRRRSFAHEVNLLREAESESGVAVVTQEDAADVLRTLASRLVTLRGDLMQFPVSYYFHPSDERSALPSVMPYVIDLADRGQAAERPESVRLAAAVLSRATEDFAQTVADSFLHIRGDSATEVMRAYAADHQRSRV